MVRRSLFLNRAACLAFVAIGGLVLSAAAHEVARGESDEVDGAKPPRIRVDISPGEIEVVHLFRFLADGGGLEVVVDASVGDPGMITMGTVVRDADAEVVIGILEANRFQIVREPLLSGRELIRISRAADTDERLERIEKRVRGLLDDVQALRASWQAGEGE